MFGDAKWLQNDISESWKNFQWVSSFSENLGERNVAPK